MAWAAGFVDAVGWVLLLHVYTSHMTGNTASFASDLARGHMQEAWRHGWPIVPFLAGLFYSAAATAIARRRGFHASFSIALVSELILLAGFIALVHARGAGQALDASSGALYGMLSCLAAAMGIQTVTVTRIGGLRVYTTYLTGSLSKFAENVTLYAFWFYDRTHGRLRHRIGKALAVSPRLSYVHHAALTAGLWLGFFTGAVCGVFTEQRWRAAALIFPMGVLAMATAIDIVRPVAAADESTEADSAH